MFFTPKNHEWHFGGNLPGNKKLNPSQLSQNIDSETISYQNYRLKQITDKDF